MVFFIYGNDLTEKPQLFVCTKTFSNFKEYMFLRGFIIILLFQLLFSTHSIGKNPQPYFRHFSTNDGLPSSQVYQAMQDADGYMWFATDQGIVKYNGYEFKQFGTKDGLLDNVVFKLFQDSRNRIWMITNSGQIFIYNAGKISAYAHNDKIKDRIKMSFQMSIYVDKFDNVYIGSSNGQFLINSRGILTSRLTPKPINNRQSMLIDERIDNRKTDAMGSGLKAGIIDLTYLKKNGVDRLIFSNNSLGRLSAIRLKENRLLFSVGTTIFELKNKSYWKLGEVPYGIINLFEDSYQNFWVCTMNGLYFFDSNLDLKKSSVYLNEKYVSGIFQDKENGYWVTTINDGVYYLANTSIMNYLSDDNLQIPQVLTYDHNSVYAGYFPAVLAKLNSSEIKPIDKNFNSTVITSLFYDFEDSILYLGNDNITYYKKNNFHTLSNARIKLSNINFVKNKFGLFSGSYNLLYRITKDSTQELANLKSKMTCVFSDSDDNLIIGFIDGALKFDLRNKTVRKINKHLNDIRINDIDLYNKSICFATAGQGLKFLNQDSSITTLGESNGLCSNTIRKIAVGDGKIWCASNNGISVIEFTDFSKFKYKISNIRINEGILDNEINDVIVFNDTVWLASKKGIIFFPSSTNFTNEYSPQVHFTHFKLNNSDTTISDNSTFPYSFNAFSLGFEAPLFKSKGNQLYSYSLFNGEDSITGKTTNREVEFLSLDPGQYSFSVKAMNNSGKWSEQAAVLNFTILSPWWKTIWFRTILFAILLLSIYLLYRRRISSFKEKYDNEKKQASLQLTAMRAQMNPHFIFNVMSSIRNYMQENDLASAEKYLTSFAKLVRYTLDNSSVQEVSLEEELNALRSYAFLEMQRFEGGFHFEIINDPEIDTDEIMVPSLLLQPFVENAIKHGIDKSEGRGKILILIHKINESVAIAIEDNGIGRANSEILNLENRGKHTSFGSRLTFERIEAFNKAYNKDIKAKIVDLTDSSGKAAGTRVEIVLS